MAHGRRTLLGALACVAVGGQAHAVRPPETSVAGIAPQRVRTYGPDLQRVLASRAPWQRFVQGDGAGWQARFDERTGTPRRMWGAGLDLGPVATAADAERAAMAFAAAHAELLGVVATPLVVRASAVVGEVAYVDVDAMVAGVAVWRGGLTFRFRAGRLVMVGADTYPDVPVVGGWTLSEAQAEQAAVDGGPAPGVAHVGRAATRMMLPREAAGRVWLRPVWVVRSSTEQPLGHWTTFVDGHDGSVIAVDNDVRWFDGRLQAEIDQRSGDGSLTVSPLPFVTVSDGRGDVFADADGLFTLGDAPSFTVSLDGRRVQLTDEAGPNSTTILAAPLRTLDARDFDGLQASLTTYVYLHEAMRWAGDYASDVPYHDGPITAVVNRADSCNAFYNSGGVVFLRAGNGCNNTGRLADVIFHEWAHGLHQRSILSGSYDGSVGEGAADTLAFLLTDDPRIAPNFYRGGGTLRTVDNTRQWPRDFVADNDRIHQNGLIFGGSMWDTRVALRARYGEPRATQTLSRIYAGLLKGGPDMESSFDEAVFADDDDSDLSNGTPHLCELVDGFGLHGLGLAATEQPELEHAPLESVQADAPIPIVLEVAPSLQACIDPATPSSGTVHWRINGGRWRVDDLILSPNGRLQVSLPPQRLGALLEYWMEVATSRGAVAHPATAPRRTHTVHVGGVLELACADFEGDDGGFVAEVAQGDPEGAFAWGMPGGGDGAAASARSGLQLWATALDGNYAAATTATLTSPVYDLGEYGETFLSYRRWLAVEDGLYDRAAILVNGREAWANWASDSSRGDEHHLDDAWALHVVDLSGFAEDGEAQVQWVLDSDERLAFGGWAVDDVCVYAPATADNRLAVTDLVAEGVDGEGAVRLSFTGPLHGPVDSVRVVRTEGRLPLGPNDGEIVAELTGVVPQARASWLDTTADGRAGLGYAVYPSDGPERLGWTRPGRNAVRADAGSKPTRTGSTPGDVVVSDDPDVGCLCDGGSRGRWGAGWLVALAWALRRRSGGPGAGAASRDQGAATVSVPDSAGW